MSCNTPGVSLMVKNVLQYCWVEEDFDVTFGDEFKKILSNLLRKGLPTNYLGGMQLIDKR